MQARMEGLGVQIPQSTGGLKPTVTGRRGTEGHRHAEAGDAGSGGQMQRLPAGREESSRLSLSMCHVCVRFFLVVTLFISTDNRGSDYNILFSFGTLPKTEATFLT